MTKKLTYQIPAVHFMSLLDKTARGYCGDGSGASQVGVVKYCLSGFGPQPGAALCEPGTANVTTYGECDAGPSHVVRTACETGDGEI